MKTFTVTPEQFGTGEMARLALRTLHPPRKPGKKRPPFKQLARQVGTVTPEQFGTGEPYWTGPRRLGHRTKPSPAIEPLPEAIARALLDGGPQHTQRLLQ